MASPQKENGFAQIATELLPAIFRLLTRLGSTQATVLSEVIAVQYGKDKPDAVRLEFKAMETKTGLSRSHLTRAASSLVRRNVLVKVGHGLYRFNKDYDTWIYDADLESTTDGGTVSEARTGTTDSGTLKVPPRAVPESTTHSGTPSYIESEIGREFNSLSQSNDAPARAREIDGLPFQNQPGPIDPYANHPPHIRKLAAEAGRHVADWERQVINFADTELGYPYGILREAVRRAIGKSPKVTRWEFVTAVCRGLESEGFKGDTPPRAEDPAVVDERRRLKDAAIAQHHEMIRAANSPTPPPLPQPAPVEGPTPAEIWRAIRPASSGSRQRAYVPPRALRGEKVVRTPVEADEAALRAAETARAEQLRLLERRGVAS